MLNRKVAAMKELDLEPWVGCDLDGTLAHSLESYDDPLVIGDPIPAMVEKIKEALEAGETIKIFTARLADEENADAIREAIYDYTEEHIGVGLDATNVKTPGMIEFWDDKARGVIENTGKFATADHPDILYYVSPTENREGILSHGLLQNRAYAGESGVYFASKLGVPPPAMDVWQVNAVGLNLEIDDTTDTPYPEDGGVDGDVWYVDHEEDITPNRLTLLSKGKTASRTVPADELQTPNITPEMTPEMREWFKGSVVVNDDDTPRVVYHGSRVPWLIQFDLSKEGSGLVSQSKNSAIWFTSNRDNASWYADYADKLEASTIDPQTYGGRVTSTLSSTQQITLKTSPPIFSPLDPSLQRRKLSRKQSRRLSSTTRCFTKIRLCTQPSCGLPTP